MSILPFIDFSAVAAAAEKKELPLFREYAYDFENNCLLKKDGKTYLIEGNEALKIWIYKALYTQRYRYTAHSRAYGNESEQLIGKTLHSDIVLSELRRYITEALMVNPYITGVENFNFVQDGSRVTVHFGCTTVYGSMQISAQQKGVMM